MSKPSPKTGRMLSPTLPFAPTADSVRRGPSVQAMLREIAYVLHATAKVKAEIISERLENGVRRLAAADKA